MSSPSNDAGPSTSSNGRKRNAPPPAAGEEPQDFQYNPRQEADERRALRSDYRTLITHAETLKRDPSLTPAALNKLIDDANQLHTRVQAPTESILDSKPLAATAESGARMAKKVRHNQDVFNTHKFVSALARFLGGTARAVRNAQAGRTEAAAADDDDAYDDDEQGRGRERDIHAWDWAKLAALSSGLTKRAVTIDFMLGPLDTQQKARRTGVRMRHEERLGERTAPRSLGQPDLQQTSATETTAHIIQVSNLLRQTGPRGVDLFKFAVDPDSYVNTIENFFHISFLIKESKATLTTDPQGNAILSYVEPSSESTQEAEADADADGDGEAGGGGGGGGGGRKRKQKQFVMEIDYPTYLASIKIHNIQHSMIPSRANRVDALSARDAIQTHGRDEES